MSQEFSTTEIGILREYSALKVEARKVETRLEEIKDEVKQLLVREDAQNQPVKVAGLGNLALRPRKVWTWSQATQQLEADLKQAKEYDKSTGGGVFEEVQDIFFTTK